MTIQEELRHASDECHPGTHKELLARAARALGDLTLMVKATRSTEYAAPLWVEDEPERGRGWAVYFHDDRYLFIPADENDMPVLDDQARAALAEIRGGK